MILRFEELTIIIISLMTFIIIIAITTGPLNEVFSIIVTCLCTAIFPLICWLKMSKSVALLILF